MLLACGPGDEHTIGLEALGLLLRRAGRPCQILGPRTSTSGVVSAAPGEQPAAVVAVSHLASARRQAIASIHAIDRLDIPVFYAGNAFAGTRARSGLPGTYLGNDLRAACGLIDDALTAPAVA